MARSERAPPPASAPRAPSRALACVSVNNRLVAVAFQKLQAPKTQPHARPLQHTLPVPSVTVTVRTRSTQARALAVTRSAARPRTPSPRFATPTPHHRVTQRVGLHVGAAEGQAVGTSASLATPGRPPRTNVSSSPTHSLCSPGGHVARCTLFKSHPTWRLYDVTTATLLKYRAFLERCGAKLSFFCASFGAHRGTRIDKAI